MRILHTSDWHVGRGIRGRSRADEHRQVLAEIAQIAAREEVDLVLVGGDLFDSATPPPEAEQVVYSALLDLVETGATVVVISGNHDNPHRLHAVKPLLDLTRVHTGAHLARPEDGGVLEVTCAGETALIALLPFLSQRNIVRADDLMSLDADQHANQYAERYRLVLGALSAPFRSDTVNLVLAHVTMVGATLGGGERQAHTVFDYWVPSQVFPASAHYAALGHLHRAQRLPGACPVWYSGSPLQLDFGEGEDEKCVLLAEAHPQTPAEVRQVLLTSGRKLRTLQGTFKELQDQAGAEADAYLRVLVEEPPRLGLADEVRELFPNAVEVKLAQAETVGGGDGQETDRLEGSPGQLFAEYLVERGADDVQLRKLFDELLQEAYEAQAS